MYQRACTCSPCSTSDHRHLHIKSSSKLHAAKRRVTIHTSALPHTSTNNISNPSLGSQLPVRSPNEATAQQLDHPYHQFKIRERRTRRRTDADSPTWVASTLIGRVPGAGALTTTTRALSSGQLSLIVVSNRASKYASECGTTSWSCRRGGLEKTW